jgi:hypothetical protein
LCPPGDAPNIGNRTSISVQGGAPQEIAVSVDLSDRAYDSAVSTRTDQDGNVWNRRPLDAARWHAAPLRRVPAQAWVMGVMATGAALLLWASDGDPCISALGRFECLPILDRSEVPYVLEVRNDRPEAGEIVLTRQAGGSAVLALCAWCAAKIQLGHTDRSRLGGAINRWLLRIEFRPASRPESAECSYVSEGSVQRRGNVILSSVARSNCWPPGAWSWTH